MKRLKHLRADRSEDFLIRCIYIQGVQGKVRPRAASDRFSNGNLRRSVTNFHERWLPTVTGHCFRLLNASPGVGAFSRRARARRVVSGKHRKLKVSLESQRSLRAQTKLGVHFLPLCRGLFQQERPLGKISSVQRGVKF